MKTDMPSKEVQPVTLGSINAEALRWLLHKNQKIAALRFVRDWYGVNLSTAKATIEMVYSQLRS